MVLTQSTSVANYAHRFRMLLLNIPDLSKVDRLFLFTRGLKCDIQPWYNCRPPRHGKPQQSPQKTSTPSYSKDDDQTRHGSPITNDPSPKAEPRTPQEVPSRW